MIPLTVTATLRSPVHLATKNTAANFLDALGHIPGRALLGAAAWASIDAGCDANAPAFAHRFVSGAVSWGDLHPLPFGEAPVDGVPMVVPRTTRVCKLFSLAHGHADTLLARHPLDQCRHPVGGKACGVGLTRLEGVLVAQQDGGWSTPKAHREHRAHVSIGFDTGIAKPGFLYSREVLQEGQVFRGQIHCVDEPTASALLDDLPKLRLAVGGGRSRGYGQIDIQLERARPTTLSVDAIRHASRYIAAQNDHLPSDARLFTLTAASPWCLREPDGGHARSLTHQWLARLMRVKESDTRVLKSEARSEPRSGWDGAAGLPTEVRHVIQVGSTFLCSINGLDDDAVQARLSLLLERGIGSHGAEGLGRVIINHPLHFSAEAARGERIDGP